MRFGDDRVERRAEQRCVHLVGDLFHPSGQNSQGDRVDVCQFALCQFAFTSAMSFQTSCRVILPSAQLETVDEPDALKGGAIQATRHTACRWHRRWRLRPIAGIFDAVVGFLTKAVARLGPCDQILKRGHAGGVGKVHRRTLPPSMERGRCAMSRASMAAR